jgi:hypothetical protein
MVDDGELAICLLDLELSRVVLDAQGVVVRCIGYHRLSNLLGDSQL